MFILFFIRSFFDDSAGWWQTPVAEITLFSDGTIGFRLFFLRPGLFLSELVGKRA
jgi:hypothetical protein